MTGLLFFSQIITLSQRNGLCGCIILGSMLSGAVSLLLGLPRPTEAWFSASIWRVIDKELQVKHALLGKGLPEPGVKLSITSPTPCGLTYTQSICRRSHIGDFGWRPWCPDPELLKLALGTRFSVEIDSMLSGDTIQRHVLKKGRHY